MNNLTYPELLELMGIENGKEDLFKDIFTEIIKPEATQLAKETVQLEAVLAMYEKSSFKQDFRQKAIEVTSEMIKLLIYMDNPKEV